MKIGFAVLAGLVIVVALAVVAMAWVRGGVRPAQMVEVPVKVSMARTDGA